jgi:hypothetical protein
MESVAIGKKLLALSNRGNINTTWPKTGDMPGV